MLKKIFGLLIVFILLLGLLPKTANPAYAVGNCRFQFNPTDISINDKTFGLKIYPEDEFVFGKWYVLIITDGNGILERSYYMFQGNGQDPVEIKSVSTPRLSPLGDATFSVYDVPTDALDIVASLNITLGQTPCNTTITIGTNPSCIIVPSIKDDSIFFNVKGLDPASKNVRRGLVIKGNNGTSPINTCRTEYELSGNNLGGTTKAMQDGIYKLSLAQSCSIFNTSDGKVLCRAPDQKTYVEFSVSKQNGISATGIECNPNQNDENYKNDACNKKGIAPFCNKDKRSSKGGFCAKIPEIVEKCDVQNGAATCRTAIGSISTDPNNFVKKVIQVILGFSGGILLLFLIINGYKLMVSQGDPEKLKEARESITSAIVGILFIIFSIFILQFLVTDILQIPGLR